MLREDFISPLRNGIIQIIEQIKSDPKNEPLSNSNVTVYPNVQILIKQIKKNNAKNECILVDLEGNKRSDKDKSEPYILHKKFMYGSMLCFSSTPLFEDLIIAVVSNRDIHLFSNGYVCLYKNEFKLID